ncbi:hypothetical protein [Acinetobacter rudis]|uniref:hypothetical protein n=1 Tax=Acinetobacter rudis TaxID=632955 RepID=UPI00333F9952
MKKALFKPVHDLLDGQVIEEFKANVTIIRDVETWAYETNENLVELKRLAKPVVVLLILSLLTLYQWMSFKPISFLG